MKSIKNKLSIFLTLLTLIILSYSCSNKDDDDTTASIILNFNQETFEDQMGGFADNAMALFNDKVFSVAGVNVYSNPNFHHDVWFSDNGENWLSVADNFFVGRKGTTLTKFNSKLWIIGGEDNAGDAQADVWSSVDGETWVSEISIADFGEVKFHQTIVFQNKLFLIAGNASTSNTEVWSSINGVDWNLETNNAANAFFGRGGHKAIIFNDKIYVIGGEATTRLNDIWESTNGSDWNQIEIQGDIFPRIAGHTTTVYNNKVWVIGGRAGTTDFSNTIYYTSDMINWHKYEGIIPFDKIAFHNTVNYNNALWVFGGYNESGLSGQIWKITEE